MQILLPEFEMTWACSYVCNNQKALGLHQHCELHQHRELQHSNAFSKFFSNVIAAIDALFCWCNNLLQSCQLLGVHGKPQLLAGRHNLCRINSRLCSLKSH
jgi:hypothetical protein